MSIVYGDLNRFLSLQKTMTRTIDAKGSHESNKQASFIAADYCYSIVQYGVQTCCFLGFLTAAAGAFRFLAPAEVP
jgi:hypothetical protein